MSIGFFDSGVGGVTVLYHAVRLMPNEDYIYYADTEHVPYGEKTKDEVRKYVFEAADFFAGQKVKAMVIACNTATSVAARELRQNSSFPVIGIEPAVKPAIAKCRERKTKVLVLATNLTLKEEKYNDLVTRLDGTDIVDGLALPGLVQFAEKFEFDEDKVVPYLKGQLALFDLEQYGTVVLGCTHFPLYKDMLGKILPPHIDIIDGGLGTARNLKKVLDELGKADEGSGKITYYKSGVKVEDETTLERFSMLFERLRRIYG